MKTYKQAFKFLFLSITYVMTVLLSGMAFADSAEEDLDTQKTYQTSNRFLYQQQDQYSNLVKQRSRYQELSKSVKRGAKIDLTKYSKTLGDYPLFPYLQYYLLLNHPSDYQLEDFESFFEENKHLSGNGYLRKKLLLRLGKHKDWENYQKFSIPFDQYLSRQYTDTLICYNIESQLRLEQNQGPISDKSYDAIKPIWLQGNSIPDQCGPLISLYEDAGHLTQALILKRIQLAIEKKRTALANYLSNQLDDEHKKEFQLWQKLSSKPKQLSAADQSFPDTPFVRFALQNTLLKIAKQDPPLALTLWKELQSKVKFTEEESNQFTSAVALKLIISNSTHLAPWLDLANSRNQNKTLNEKQLVIHIKDKSWSSIISLYEKLSPQEQGESIWQYWYSRSHIEHESSDGIHPKAYRILNNLSKKRNYYGFLASFHLSNTPILSKQNFPINDDDLKKVFMIKGIQRAHEFYVLGDYVAASREWTVNTELLDTETKGVAAVLASQWGWYEQAILTAKNSNQFNNISLRFPLAFASDVNFFSARYGIPNEWIFSIIRQESAFSSRAESRVGALGLMQLMPATASEVARKTSSRRPKNGALFKPEYNIRLGSFYLRELRDRFDGNIILASAAYNAGPYKVKEWVKNVSNLPVELWIETIPYKETRNYVKNVLTYQIIYQRELGRQTNTEQLFLPVNTLQMGSR